MSTVKKNVIANYLGQGWNALMGLAFIPLYIKYLGVEAYGLIGIFAFLQVWLALLDMGLTPTLSREMARFTGGAHKAQSIRDLLRSIEIIGLGIAVIIALGVWAASGWLASDWLRVEKLPVGVVAQAFTIMGVVIALRFIENIYRSSIMGLQRQVLLNIVLSVIATMRGLGAVGILIWVSPTIKAFFVWQGILSFVTTGFFAIYLYRTLPLAERPARFSPAALKEIRRFAVDMMVVTFLSILLTQVDKILLSRLLTLEAFGYYVLAWTVASVLNMLSGPIMQAFYPRFTELVAQDNVAGLIAAYHRGAQLLTVLTGTAAIMLIVFGDAVMALWLKNPELSEQVTLLVVVLSLGTLLNGLMWIPSAMWLAYGWSSFSVKVNFFSVLVIVPAILWAAPKYGSIGAAWVWVGLNVGYGTIAVYFLHRRLLTTEKWRWYRQDVAMPLIAGAIVAVILRWATPNFSNAVAQLIVLLISAGFVLAASALAAHDVRHQLVRYVPQRIKSLCVKVV